MEKAMVAGSLLAHKGNQGHVNGLIICLAALLLSSTSLTAQAQGADANLLRQNAANRSVERPLEDYLNRLNEAAQAIEQANAAEAANNNAATPPPQQQTNDDRASDSFPVPDANTPPRSFAANIAEQPAIDTPPLEMGAALTEEEEQMITGATTRAPARNNITQRGAEAERRANSPLKTRKTEAAQKTLPLDSNNVRREDTPYAATGIPAGAWRFRPTVSSGIEVTSSEGNTETASITTFTLNGIADLSDTQLNLDSDLSITAPLSEGDTELEGAINLNGTHSISNAVQAFGNLNYANERVSATGGLNTDFATETTLQSLDIGAGLRSTGGKMQITGSLGAIREFYDDATITSGVLQQDDRNNTVFSGALRLGYEVSPSLTPFAQLVVGRRMMENTVDSLGFERSGYEIDATLGTEIDLGEKLRGEISAGWLSVTFDDARLKTENSLALRGLLNWSPQRDTNLELAATSVVDAGSAATIGPSTTYGLSATATHLFRDNLTASAQLGYSFRDDANGANENLISARMDATYWFNRTFGMTGNISHQIADTAASGSQGSTTLRLGVTVQR